MDGANAEVGFAEIWTIKRPYSKLGPTIMMASYVI